MAGRTAATLTFHVYRPGSSLAADLIVNPTAYHPAGTPAGTFNLLPPPLVNGNPLPLGGALPLVNTDLLPLHAGEPLFITLADGDQNLDPSRAEIVLVSIESNTGDTELLRLTETGPATGVFAGYLMTSAEADSDGSGVLHVTPNDRIVGLYADPVDGSDTSTDTALVDPLGIVFDSRTGEPVTGALVRLYWLSGPNDSSGGVLADGHVFADDGVTPFPAEVLAADGSFRFPLVEPGYYRLEVLPPANYLFPSTAEIPAAFTYTVVGGSRGEAFEVVPGPLINIDLPVDPLANALWLSKLVSRGEAAVGDFLQYRLSLENNNTAATLPRVVIEDRLPPGFRYQQGSTRLNGSPAADPQIGADGRLLRFAVGDLAPAARIELSYVVEVAAGTRHGQAINRAQAVDAGGGRSNLATASVEIREEFFRDRTFLLGRVVAGSCAEPDTAKPGVEGVRLYLEDGSYVVTDADGRYHFEGLEPGNHVVQVDTFSLPDGFELLACEENSQRAGRSHSQFVDLQGGTLWQVNFHVKPPAATTAPAAAADASGAAAPAAAAGPEPAKGLLSPVAGRAVARIEAVRIRLDAKLTPRLTLDREEISADRIGFRMTEPESGTTLYTYIGIDFGAPGSHALRIEGLDPFGNVRFQQDAELFRTGDIASIRLAESAENIADGRTPVKIRVEMIDVSGRPIQTGISLALDDGELQPLGTRPRNRLAPTDALDPAAEARQVEVDGDGWLSFDPVERSGRYPIRLVANEAVLETEVFVKPQMRDWILVGFAEGTTGYQTLSGNQVSAEAAGIDEHGYTDGRVKFFAKGAIKGEWLLTLAYDSDKPELDGDSLYQVIDPDRYYPLYGDDTRTGYEAASARDLYVKLERDQFYALFGDMHTGLTRTELSKYSRNLNGFQSELQSERFDLTVFAADSRQAFVKDELRGDGTSGRYALSTRGLVINSEEVVIETRDRFHNERIVKETRLARHLDYDIDYDAGTLFFKRPVPSKDEAFNPVFIVVRYEVRATGGSHLNYGGRGAVRFLDRTIEVGASYVREDNGAAEGDLYGADVTVHLTPQTTLHAEVAATDVTELDDDRQGDAYLAEIEHRGEQVDGRAWFRQQDRHFGLGQQNGGTLGQRTYGVEGTYRFAPLWNLSGEAYHEDNLTTGAERDVATLETRYRADRYSLSLGLREARDRLSAGETQRSRQLIFGGDWHTANRKLTLRAAHEQALGQSDENLDFPTRTVLGVDYKLSHRVSLFAEQEFTWGDQADSEGTRLGFKTTPWRGGTVSTTLERRFDEQAERVFALFGVGQSWQLTPHWSVDLAVDRSYTIKDQPAGERVNEAVPPASGGDDDFTAVSIGAAYKTERWSWWNRLETRRGDDEDKIGISSALAGEVHPGLAASARLLAFLTDQAGGSRRDETELRLGLAYRPNQSRWIVLERLDLERNDEEFDNGSDVTTWRVVNHLHANYRAGRQWQASCYYGLKYVRETYDSQRFAGFTDMLAGEVRYNLGARWDIGAGGATLHSWDSHQLDYSAGVSVGLQVMDNAWLSAGYNVAGFEDDDFSAANYTAQGPFIRFRVKFDQQSIRDAAEWLNR